MANIWNKISETVVLTSSAKGYDETVATTVTAVPKATHSVASRKGLWAVWVGCEAHRCIQSTINKPHVISEVDDGVCPNGLGVVHHPREGLVAC